VAIRSCRSIGAVNLTKCLDNGKRWASLFLNESVNGQCFIEKTVAVDAIPVKDEHQRKPFC